VYTLAYSQTKYDLQITFEGRARELIVSVPTKQPPQGGYPVVFMLHGTSGDKDVFYNFKGWKELGQQENFVTVFPSSLKWCFVEDGVIKNTTRFVCGGLLDSICPVEIPKLIDDVAFFRKVIDLMEDTLSINKKKLFLSGFSNGSCMAHKIAMEAGDLFAAASGSSSPLHALDSLTPQKRIPFWYVLGTKDDRYFTPNFPTELPYEGDSILIYHNRALTRALTCQGLTQNYRKIETAINKTYIWSECRPGVDCAPYLFTINKGQTHQYPNGNNYPMDGPKLFWEFFNNPPQTTMASGIKDEKSPTGVILSPNPVSDILRIFTNMGDDMPWSLKISDMQGRIVRQVSGISGSEKELDVRDLSVGVYNVTISNTSVTVNRRLVKQ